MALRVPVNSPRITQGFGANPAYYKQFGQSGHNGIDYGANTNTPIYAAEAGTVHYEGWGQHQQWMGAVAGIVVIIDHGKFYTGYAHMIRTVVNKGQSVKKGQVIGYVGQTGTATGPHLHFEVLPKPVNTSNGYFGRTNPNPYFIEEKKLVDKNDLNYIYQYGPLGRKRNGNEGEDVYLGKTAAFVINDHKNSTEGKRRAKEVAEAFKRPKMVVKEVVVTKEVPVQVEKVVEVPVEVIVEKEVIREVVKGDDERSIGDLLSAVWRKLFNIK